MSLRLTLLGHKMHPLLHRHLQRPRRRQVEDIVGLVSIRLASYTGHGVDGF